MLKTSPLPPKTFAGKVGWQSAGDLLKDWPSGRYKLER
jgi:hypothetical protein